MTEEKILKYSSVSQALSKIPIERRKIGMVIEIENERCQYRFMSLDDWGLKKQIQETGGQECR